MSDECRNLFKEAGLSYSDITTNHFHLLRNMVDDELYRFRTHGNASAKSMNMRIGNFLKRDAKILDTKGLKEGYIKVDGAYFTGREAISFNRDGFIGFAGWASTCNAEPMYKAFNDWCLIVSKAKGQD